MELNETVLFFEEVNALTPKISLQLDNLGNMEKNVEAFKRTQNENSERIETLEKTCNQILLDSIAVRCNVAASELALAEMTEKDESELPQAIQIKLKGIRRYLGKLRGKNDALDVLTTKLNSKFIELIRRKSQIPIPEEEMTELDIIVTNLNIEIEIAENWQKKADDAWKSLVSETTSYIETEEKASQYKAVANTCIATGAAVGIAAGAAAGGIAYYGASKLVVGTAGAAGAAGVIATGSVTFGMQIRHQVDLALGKYNVIRAKIAKLRENLDHNVGTKEEFKIKAAGIQKLAEKKLKVKDNGKGENKGGQECISHTLCLSKQE